MLESERAYRQLKEMIVFLELRPGQVIREALLMERLQVGRTPLRDALSRLNHEGLVKVLPRRGTLVTEIGIDDLQKIYEIRVVLEGYCARLAALRITEERLQDLKLLLESAESFLEDLRVLIEIDRDFHRSIAKAAQNEYLEGILSNLYDHSLRLWFVSFARAGKVRETLFEHQDILKALRARDPEAAERAARYHVTQFREKVRSVL